MTCSSAPTTLWSRVIALLLFLGSAAPALPAGPSGHQADSANAADVAFQREFGERFFDQWWRMHSDSAIENGYYKSADRLNVPDARARASELEQLQRWQAQLHKIDPQSLTPPVRADWTLLENLFNSDRWGLTELRA